MITVNTNLASMLVQKNFRTSTNSLNTAIERLTTGFRINSAKDDAAGKAVAIDMDVKLSSNEVAQNNVAMGVSLLNTAEGNILLMKDKVQRCRDLCEQALNGVYDNDSKNAIKSELTQLVATIDQIKEKTEFNGKHLFEASGGGGASIEEILPNLPQVQANGFIGNVVTQNATTTIDATATTVAEAETALRSALSTSGVIGISNELGLQALANVVNGTNDTALDCLGKTIVLTQNIDLGGISNWTAIGTNESYWDSALGDLVFTGTTFKGNFNGNGHTVSNMRITSPNNYAGLFAVVDGGTISNTCINNANISIEASPECSAIGLLAAACVDGSEIKNCYTTGSIMFSGSSLEYQYIGGIIGFIGKTDEDCTESIKVNDCYSSASINTDNTSNFLQLGGIIGGSSINSGEGSAIEVNNCFYEGNLTVKTNGSWFYMPTTNVGGIVGCINDQNYSILNNCYSKGTINCSTYDSDMNFMAIGGIAGIGLAANINNSGSECIISGSNCNNSIVGGIIGSAAAANLNNVYSKSKLNSSQNTNSINQEEILYGTWYPQSASTLIGGNTFIPLIYIGMVSEETVNDTYKNTLSNCKYDGSVNPGINSIVTGPYTGTALDVSLDIDPSEVVDNTIKLQIGLDGSADSSITFDFGLNIDTLHSILSNPASSSNLATIDGILSNITTLETQIGVGLNRLESVQESLQTQQKTLTAARSIVQDTDVSQESARYIRSQILQQASAALLTTANQAPSLLLSLINGMRY